MGGGRLVKMDGGGCPYQSMQILQARKESSQQGVDWLLINFGGAPGGPRQPAHGRADANATLVSRPTLYSMR